MADLSSQPTPIQTFYIWYRQDRLHVNRRYQRKLVWSLLEKQKLIDSILKGYPIPAVLLAEREGRLEVIDGLQRLHAILSYIETAFPLDDGSLFDLEFFPAANDYAHKGVFEARSINEDRKLPSDMCSRILNYNFAVSIVRNAEEGEINDIFDRINTYGHRLSDQERRQSGVQNKFADLVRSTACIYRGDVSRDVLPLHAMPSISIDLPTAKHGYSVRSDEVFWCAHGILRSTDLRDSLDEQVIADLVACIVGPDLISRSKAAIDELYEDTSEVYGKTISALEVYGADKLTEEIKFCISRIQEVCAAGSPEKLRNIVFKQRQTNPFPSVFANILIAFHEVIIKEEKDVADFVGLKESLRGIASRMEAGQGGASAAQRRQNIDTVRGVISKHFMRSSSSSNIYNDHNVIDIENVIRESMVEKSTIELKQGILKIDRNSVDPKPILNRLPEVVCALANNGPQFGGRLVIGVADNQSDARRVNTVDGVKGKQVGERYVVGIAREAKRMAVTAERYHQLIRDAIRLSSLSDPLKTNALACIDYNSYFGLGIIIISVRPQSVESYLGDDIYYREGDETRKAKTSKEAGAVTARFK